MLYPGHNLDYPNCWLVAVITINVIGFQIFQNKLEIEFLKPFKAKAIFISYFCFDSIPIVATHFSSDNATSE